MDGKEALEAIRASPGKTMLTPGDIAPILHMAPYAINVLARDGMLPFEYLTTGTVRKHVKIPRDPFLAWWDGVEYAAVLRRVTERLGAMGTCHPEIIDGIREAVEDLAGDSAWAQKLIEDLAITN